MSTDDVRLCSAQDIAAELWLSLELPPDALNALRLDGNGPGLPSSFQVGPFAQATIAISALAAATLHAYINSPSRTPQVTVPLRHACAEFKSEQLYALDGKTTEAPWGPIGGLYAALDGYVRIHDAFPHHRSRALKLLGLDETATRHDVANAVKRRKAIQLEEEAIAAGCVIAALRSRSEWRKLPQAQCLPKIPISVRKATTSGSATCRMGPGSLKCLQGLRVLDLTRVIAGPIAGKTLAAHGADVLWVTSPHLPTLPDLDSDVQRGKRRIQLDLRTKQDKETLFELIKHADVFLQGYRPGALANLGLSQAAIHEVNPNLIIANLSAYGTKGPWSDRRGFDSIVQTCSGMNVAEAERYGDGSIARPLPCQALDHGSGYLLATGIIAALYKRATEGGGYIVDVSLAGTMNYLCSLGQYDGSTGFDSEDFRTHDDATEFMETRQTSQGKLSAVRHSARIEGLEVGWRLMPDTLAGAVPEW